MAAVGFPRALELKEEFRRQARRRQIRDAIREATPAPPLRSTDATWPELLAAEIARQENHDTQAR